jgi:DNA-binding transcriptional LysR family regulator
MHIRLDDMRLFATVATARSFTSAARELDIPKQTLSRRVGELEATLGVQLVLRTTRRMQLTAAGERYAAKCRELVRIAEDANRVVAEDGVEPRGTLRVTADPLLGEAFLPPVLNEFTTRWPSVKLEVLLTQRRVDLIEEGFDVAFRVGHVDDVALKGRALGPARIRFCASPSYLRKRGSPKAPRDLADHDCVVVRADLGPTTWPFRSERGGTQSVSVDGRYRCNSHVLAYQAVLSGLGIGVFAEFACARDLRRRRLSAVLDEWRVDVGQVWLVHPVQRFANVTVQRFVELAVEQLGSAPWAFTK